MQLAADAGVHPRLLVLVVLPSPGSLSGVSPGHLESRGKLKKILGQLVRQNLPDFAKACLQSQDVLYASKPTASATTGVPDIEHCSEPVSSPLESSCLESSSPSPTMTDLWLLFLEEVHCDSVWNFGVLIFWNSLWNF